MTRPEMLPTPPAPLRADADGVVRVGATRVTLDTVVGAFHNGCTAEEIATRYPSLALGEVYAVLAHYLANRAEVDAYLEAREAEATTIRRDVEERTPLGDARERLLARKRLAS